MEEVSLSTVATTATATTATATGHHLLRLEGYRRLKGIHGNGESFDSCQFQAAGHDWKLRCYPNGHRKEDAGFFTVYLVHDDSAAVHAEVELALVNPHTNLFDLGAPPPPPYCRSGHSSGGHGAVWGFPQFIRAAELERRGFLRGDCVAVRCTITAVEMAAVKDMCGLVKASDVDRLGVRICDCDDDGCKRRHRRRPEGLTKAFLTFCRRSGDQ